MCGYCQHGGSGLRTQRQALARNTLWLYLRRRAEGSISATSLIHNGPILDTIDRINNLVLTVKNIGHPARHQKGQKQRREHELKGRKAREGDISCGVFNLLDARETEKKHSRAPMYGPHLSLVLRTEDQKNQLRVLNLVTGKKKCSVSQVIQFILDCSAVLLFYFFCRVFHIYCTKRRNL